jgi:hypothetical protein
MANRNARGGDHERNRGRWSSEASPGRGRVDADGDLAAEREADGAVRGLRLHPRHREADGAAAGREAEREPLAEGGEAWPRASPSRT